MVAYTASMRRYVVASTALYQSPDARRHRANADGLTEHTESIAAAILLQGKPPGQ